MKKLDVGWERVELINLDYNTDQWLSCEQPCGHFGFHQWQEMFGLA